MSNDDRYTDLRPLGEELGKETIQRLSNRLEVIGVVMTITGLFVSLGGIETVVGLLGLAISGLSRSQRFLRWIGERKLPKLN
jgi:hypothetical protein